METPKPQPPKDTNDSKKSTKIDRYSKPNQPLLNNEYLLKLKNSLEEANNEQQAQ
jgi:hypothetical protein